MQETLVRSWVRKIHWRKDRLPTPVFVGFPCGSAGKESTCNVGDLGLTPGLGRSPGEGKGYPLQCSGLENSMDSIVHGVAKSQTWLQCRRVRFDPWVWKIPCRRKWQPLQYSCLKNLMDSGAWWATVHGVTKSLTRLSDFHFHLLKWLSENLNLVSWASLPLCSRVRSCSLHCDC